MEIRTLRLCKQIVLVEWCGLYSIRLLTYLAQIKKSTLFQLKQRILEKIANSKSPFLIRICLDKFVKTFALFYKVKRWRARLPFMFCANVLYANICAYRTAAEHFHELDQFCSIWSELSGSQ